MKEVTLKLKACAVPLLALVLAFTAGAHPYASSITNSNGVVTWVLNESATDVKLLFDSGTTTVDLGSGPVVGRNTFALGNHTNFAILVYKVGANALTQISSDANPYNYFYGPRGVAVNQNSRNVNFGRVYVANAYAGSAGPRGYTTKGVYALDAASGDCLGLGNTAAASGLALGNSTTYSPFKVGLGPDGSVYVGDAAQNQIGGVWVADAKLTSFRSLFPLGTPYYNTTTSGLNFGRAAGTPNVTGSLATGDLVLKLVMWDLNLANPPGTFLPTKVAYNNFYQYNLGAGPLPWTGYPTVITNPISIGTVNAVNQDAEIAPDGKIFITACRFNPGDGQTNVCVLDSTGTQILWDSKTQSRSYFNDYVNDRLSLANYSIAISPDDKYVLIQGRTNGNFMVMALTNGIPDVSTLTINTSVGTGGGLSTYASTWDVADNIYVSNSGAQVLRIFSPGMTTTCITSNDWTGTNGSFQFTATSAALAAIQVQPTNQVVQCSSDATLRVNASGVALQYQWYQTDLGALNGATTPVLTVSNLTLAQSGASYFVVVTNTLNSVTSQVAVLSVTDTLPPVVTLNGSATLAVLQGSPFVDPGATAGDACAGSLPVAATGVVDVTSPGTYYLTYLATDPSGNVGTNTRAVLVQTTNGPPLIVQAPANQVASCTGPAVFSVLAAGAGPLSYQWYNGAQPLADGPGVSGATSATLSLSGLRLTQAGGYSVVVTNSLGSATSAAATLTVNDTTTPVVSVLGSTVVNLAQSTTYVELGATASDPCVGSLPVFTSGSVNVNGPGTYVVTYTATNSTGLTGSAQRLVTVAPLQGPVTAGAASLIPVPVIQSNLPGVFTLCPTQPYPPAPGQALMRILVDAASQTTGQYLASALARATGYRFQLVASTATNAVRGAILITTSNALPSLGAEGYELTVAPDSVVIRAPAQAGTFYGVQSLLQLLPPQIYSPQVVSGVGWVAPCVYLQDQPRFAWRGVMLDVARHFFTKDEVKQLLDVMAMHKLNTFHWHLTDDQAWRLEITNYPKLTSVGAFRNGIDYGLPPRASDIPCPRPGQYGGYYTQADAREVVAYAAERHITVVPEIELPSHATALLAAYPELGCGNPPNAYNMDYPYISYPVDLISPATSATQAFVTNVLNEVMALFPSYYIHCGGDEVQLSGDHQWNSYPPDLDLMTSYGIAGYGDWSILAYQWYFSYNLAGYLQSHGRMMLGWTEIADVMYVPGAALMDWKSPGLGNAVYAATNGMPVVMAPESNCYLNYVEGDSTSLSQEPPFVVGGAPDYLSLSGAYAFNPVPAGLPAAYTTNILGGEGTLFTEYVPSFRNVLFKLFPRAAALAEATWSPPEAQNFSSFISRLAAQKQRYQQGAINFDHETLPQIGSWGPTLTTSATTNDFNITANVTAAGELDVSFWYLGGASLAISSVALLVDGVQVDMDAHFGLAQPSSAYQSAKPYIPYFTLYVLHLPELKRGAPYTIRTVTYSSGGTSGIGNLYLANWN